MSDALKQILVFLLAEICRQGRECCRTTENADEFDAIFPLRFHVEDAGRERWEKPRMEVRMIPHGILLQV